MISNDLIELILFATIERVVGSDLFFRTQNVKLAIDFVFSIVVTTGKRQKPANKINCNSETPIDRQYCYEASSENKIVN